MNEEDFASITAAMSQPEFMGIFKEYVSELADPTNRKEQIAYLNELEANGEIPAGKLLIKPDPWICVESEIIGPKMQSRFFVNITTCSQVDNVSFSANQLRLPFVLGPIRQEREAVCVDATVGANACTLITTSKLIVATTDLIADKLEEQLKGKYVSRDFRLRREWRYRENLFDTIMPMLINS